MVAGFACHFDGTEPEGVDKAAGVVAVITGPKYADHKIIRVTLSEGLKSGSVHLWCMAQPLRTSKPDAEAVAREVLEAAGAAVVYSPMNPYWKHSRGDDRRKMIDCELALYCSRCVVFDDGGVRCKFWREQAKVNPKVRLL